MLFVYLRTLFLYMQAHCLVPVHNDKAVAVGKDDLELVLLFVFMPLSFMNNLSTRLFGPLTLGASLWIKLVPACEISRCSFTSF